MRSYQTPKRRGSPLLVRAKDFHEYLLTRSRSDDPRLAAAAAVCGSLADLAERCGELGPDDLSECLERAYLDAAVVWGVFEAVLRANESADSHQANDEPAEEEPRVTFRLLRGGRDRTRPMRGAKRTRRKSK